MCNRINGFVGVSNSQCVHGQPMEQTRSLLCTCHSSVASVARSLSITVPVSLLANEFDVRSALHGHMSLAAVNQCCVIHEALNCCKYLKIH